MKTDSNADGAAAGGPRARDSKIVHGIEFFREREPGELCGHDVMCARCGSDVHSVTCWNCGGDGFLEPDDWQDDDGDYGPRCEVCRGRGGWFRCLSSREWCEANPLPGREHINTTAYGPGEFDD